MSIITVMEANIKLEHQKNWYSFLLLEKQLIEFSFDWLELFISKKNKSLIGKGVIQIEHKKVNILLSYSPFNRYRYDRIYIQDSTIKHNDEIHLYGDMSLCLYHPIIDKPYQQCIPLYKMIPWITEWIVFYNQWKKYGVWLGREIKH